MDDFYFFEPGTHEFIGTITMWSSKYGELITDSGVKIPLLTEGKAPIREGTRVKIEARKFRPLFQIEACNPQ